MKKMFLALITLIIVGMFIPAVSAETIVDEEPIIYEDTGGTLEIDGMSFVYDNTFDRIRLESVESRPIMPYIGVTVTPDTAKSMTWVHAEGEYHITYTAMGQTKSATMHVEHSKDFFGNITRARFLIFFDDWDTTGYVGPQYIILSEPLWNGTSDASNTDTSSLACVSSSINARRPSAPIIMTVPSVNDWKNRLIVTDDILNSYQINLQRVYGGVTYPSEITILKGNSTVFYQASAYDFSTVYLKSEIDAIKIQVGSNIYQWTLETAGTDIPDSSSVTVYVKNSQTGAAIANSNIVIDALVNGEYHPVANTTEPSGIFSITLQPTGGGQPNPDSYRLIATADGYNNPMPEINFTVTDSKKYIYCYLDPIAGGPENENNTFIDFYVRDLSANPVSGATVKFGKYTLITNSHGYTVFEVPKNTDYTYTVSKSGYGPVTGNANIGANDRYIINAVIGPAVTPTAPTAIPTDTPTGPTPTLTAPTGEPVNNLLEWFAAHFGMILGGGVEIGKIFMWLCFTVPVGVYIGKEAKSGAAGFMAGAGIVTLFFVIIGWVPIWIVVLLALIIGLLYAKVFNNSDTGGGR